MGLGFKALMAVGTLCFMTAIGQAADRSILVQSTTSTDNSGLYRYLLPIFEKETGIRVKVVAVGTGQAIANAANCDADVLLVHAKDAEEKFVASGYGVERFELMYNDFIIVGPKDGKAGVSGMGDAVAAFRKIAQEEAPFASRGDDSGTHKKELALWKAAGIEPKGRWYRSTGSGMGTTLNTGIAMGAYVMTDRATWISFGNKADYIIEVEGDERLHNQYSVIAVNPDKCPYVKTVEGQAFVDWLLSDKGQDIIASFKMDGHQLFYPNAIVSAAK